MDFNDTPEQAAFRSEVKNWLSENATPLSESRVLARSEYAPEEELEKAKNKVTNN